MKYQQFIFESYLFDRTLKTLTLNYRLDSQLQFSEVYKFDFEFIDEVNPDLLDSACQLLFFLAGVSYYKTYLPPEIVVRKGDIDKETAEFLSRTWQRGLGEFFYINQLDPNTAINFPVTNPSLNIPANQTIPQGQLVGIGGGKDSLVSLELLKNQPNIVTWSVGHRKQLEPLIKQIGLKHMWVERTMDPQLAELKNSDAFNGHIPISSIFAATGCLVALLSGVRDVVVSNEASANEATLSYQGVAINHQYSKTLEFEQDFQHLIQHRLNGSVRYYSLLRPFSELRIAEIFAGQSFEKYKSVFSSCNHAYRQGVHKLIWCGQCPKCAFLFLALTPFVKRDDLEVLFGGKNLLLADSLESTYKQLLGIEGDKPLECVGTIAENRQAMRLSQNIYSELNKYEFDLPAAYDYRTLGPHSIPEDILPLLPN